ncbi:MAG: ATP synthase F1 subunit epsilon [Lachnospiraceae bacterium]|nr:ATP synthase F1 subunit epsilon [Lachnospiraceae bacterium]
MNSFNLKIYESDGVFYEGEAIKVTIPAHDGEYGIWADHENVVMAVVPGILRFTTFEEKTYLASVSNGMFRVDDGDVLVLVETAEHPEEIDVERARRREQAARDAMREKKSLREYRLAELQLKRELVRLKLAAKRDLED